MSDSEHSIPGIIDFVPGNGDLTKAIVTTKFATGEMYLYGAHVTHFQPVDQPPVLFLSGSSRFQAGKAIRGGVPICFPWFGPLEGRDTAPAHGFARTSLWELKSTNANPDGSSTLVLELTGSEKSNDFWPHAFRARYTVTFGQTLHLEFAVFHLHGEPFMFEEALHSYFHVGDVRQVTVTGLGGTPYLDKTRGARETPGAADPLHITGETDRVYLETTSECVIDDPQLGRKISIKKTGSDSTVVWNPWIEKSKSMADFGDDEWPGMLCIETCNVERSAVAIGPGQSHVMTAEIRSIPRG